MVVFAVIILHSAIVLYCHFVDNCGSQLLLPYESFKSSRFIAPEKCLLWAHGL